MKKTIISLILLLVVATVSISGCETKTANKTWGEKKISLDLITISNNTTADHYDWEGITYYYIDGYLLNKNPFDALNVKLKATFYDSNGDIIATNETPYLEPKSIPLNGISNFHFEVQDKNKDIVRYKVELVDAQSEYSF